MNSDGLPNGALARMGTPRFRLSPPVHSVSISPDEAILAVSTDKGVVVMDAKTGQINRQFLSNDVCGQVLFGPSPDSLALLYPGSIRLENLRTTRSLVLPIPTPTSLACLAPFTRAGILACLSISGTDLSFGEWIVTFWNIRKGKILAQMPFPLTLGTVGPLVWSAGQEQLLIAGDPKGLLHIVSASDRCEIGPAWRAHSCQVVDADVAQSGKLLATVDESGEVRIWAAKDKTLIKRTRLDSEEADATKYNVRFGYGDRYLVCRAGQWLRILTVDALETIAQVRCNVSTMAISAEKRQLVAYNDSGIIRIFDLSRQMEQAPRELGEVTCVRFANEEGIVVADARCAVAHWRFKAGELSAKNYSGDLVSLNSTGSLIAVAEKRKVRVYQTKDDVLVASLPVKAMIGNLGLSAGGRFLTIGLVGGSDKVSVYDLSLGTRLGTYSGYMGQMSVDGSILAITGGAYPNDDSFLDVYDVRKLEKVRTMLVMKERIRCVLSARNQYIAISQSGGIIQVVRLRDWEVMVRIHARPDWLTCLAFSNSGEFIAAGGQDGKVYIWHATTGKVLGQYSGHVFGVSDIAFAPCDKIMASGGEDGIVVVWKVG